MTEFRGNFDRVRTDQFAGLQNAAYLNAASLGPLPRSARVAMAAFNERRGAVHTMRDADFLLPLDHTRERAARLVGSDVDEIALAGNTSFGINLAALGLRVEPGSTVLASSREFPANVYPWMERERFRFELLPTGPQGRPDEERLIDRVERGGISIVALSSVQFVDGYRADLHRIGQVCRDHGTIFVIDAIQSLGHYPLNVRHVCADVVATGGHKWLCGPFGTGFVYVRREIQDQLEPAAVGWSSMQGSQRLDSLLDYDRTLLRDARRYEVGTQPLQDFAGFAESLALILECGPESIWNHVDRLLSPLRQWLVEHEDIEIVSDLNPKKRSGILSFRPPAVEATVDALSRAGVVCSIREGSIRVAAHLYNTPPHIDRVIEVLDSGAREGWGMIDRVSAIADEVRDTYAADIRLAVFEIEAVVAEDGLVVYGASSVPAAVEELHRRIADIEPRQNVRDEVIRLPAPMDGRPPHALVNVATAPMLAGPIISGSYLSTVLLGHRVTVLREYGRWQQCRSSDGYIGWMHRGYLRRVTEAEARVWEIGSNAPVHMSLGSEVLQESGAVMARLPWGCKVGVLDGIAYLPDGRCGRITGESVALSELRREFPPDAEAVLATAHRWAGTPYLWGGITPWGADCSGLVQAVYRTHGIELRRDSDQQAEEGTGVEPGESFEGLGPGDLLFFAEEQDRISHVAISMGGSRIIHSAVGNGGVSTNDLLGENGYERDLRRLFVRARRVITPVGL